MPKLDIVIDNGLQEVWWIYERFTKGEEKFLSQEPRLQRFRVPKCYFL